MEIYTFSFNAFENIVWKMAAILSQPQWVKKLKVYDLTPNRHQAIRNPYGDLMFISCPSYHIWSGGMSNSIIKQTWARKEREYFLPFHSMPFIIESWQYYIRYCKWLLQSKFIDVSAFILIILQILLKLRSPGWLIRLVTLGYLSDRPISGPRQLASRI